MTGPLVGPCFYCFSSWIFLIFWSLCVRFLSVLKYGSWTNTNWNFSIKDFRRFLLHTIKTIVVFGGDDLNSNFTLIYVVNEELKLICTFDDYILFQRIFVPPLLFGLLISSYFISCNTARLFHLICSFFSLSYIFHLITFGHFLLRL